MKKFKLFSGIGLLSAVFILMIYSMCLDLYGDNAFYATVLVTIGFVVFLVFIYLCLFLIAYGLVKRLLDKNTGKLALYSGAGLLSATLIVITYFACVMYGMSVGDSFYVTSSIIVFIAFIYFCVWLISDGLKDD